MSNRRTQGKSSQRGAEVFNALEQSLVHHLTATLPGKEVRGAVAKAVEEIRISFGGQHIYIPIDRARRDAAIWAAFTGDNHNDLVAQYGITISGIYRILAQERERRRIKQCNLMDVL